MLISRQAPTTRVRDIHNQGRAFRKAIIIQYMFKNDSLASNDVADDDNVSV